VLNFLSVRPSVSQSVIQPELQSQNVLDRQRSCIKRRRSAMPDNERAGTLLLTLCTPVWSSGDLWLCNDTAQFRDCS